MKELWTNQDPSYHSSRWHFSDLKFSQAPQKNLTSRWIGSSAPNRRRRHRTIAGILCMSPRSFAWDEEVRTLAAAAGRDPNALTMSLRVEVEAHGGASSQRAQNRSRLPGDDVEQMSAGIMAYQNAGVDHVVLALNTGDVVRIRALMEDIARQVIPQFR